MTTETYEGLRRELDQVDRRVGQIEDHQRVVTLDAISRVVFEAVDRLRLEMKEDVKNVREDIKSMKAELKDDNKDLKEDINNRPTAAETKLLMAETEKDSKRFSISQWIAFGTVVAGFSLVAVELFRH